MLSVALWPYTGDYYDAFMASWMWAVMRHLALHHHMDQKGFHMLGFIG